MPKATISNPGLPIGEYICSFEAVEEVDHPEYGPGWKWEFCVSEGPLKDKRCFRTTKPEPTLKNSCGKFLAALAGQKPADGLDVDTDDYLGHQYKVMVTEAQSGDSTRVDSFTPTGEAPADVPFD